MLLLTLVLIMPSGASLDIGLYLVSLSQIGSKSTLTLPPGNPSCSNVKRKASSDDGANRKEDMAIGIPRCGSLVRSEQSNMPSDKGVDRAVESCQFEQPQRHLIMPCRYVG